jgi:hypothetical protein
MDCIINLPILKTNGLPNELEFVQFAEKLTSKEESIEKELDLMIGIGIPNFITNAIYSQWLENQSINKLINKSKIHY